MVCLGDFILTMGGWVLGLLEVAYGVGDLGDELLFDFWRSFRVADNSGRHADNRTS